MAVKKTEVKPVVKPVVKPEKAAAKAEAPKTEIVKTEVKDVTPAAPVKAEEKKAAVKKAAPAKKAPETKTEKKEAVTTALHVQFAGKSYSQEDLMKIAKDVWRYDLKQKVGDLTSIELYVKPEESTVYYVMNKEFTGSFFI